MQAFCPALIVPGIGYSDDKLLQTRIFSYADTQRHRLGPNYLLLPANAPKSAFHNNHHEGFMNFMTRDEEVGSSFSFASCIWLGNRCRIAFWGVEGEDLGCLCIVVFLKLGCSGIDTGA